MISRTALRREAAFGRDVTPASITRFERLLPSLGGAARAGDVDTLVEVQAAHRERHPVMGAIGLFHGLRLMMPWLRACSTPAGRPPRTRISEAAASARLPCSPIARAFSSCSVQTSTRPSQSEFLLWPLASTDSSALLGRDGLDHCPARSAGSVVGPTSWYPRRAFAAAMRVS